MTSGTETAASEDDPGDVLGQLAYVAQHIDTIDKETIVLVAKVAMAEIIELRIAVAVHGRDEGI
jgi:hypothetical protein